MMNISKIISLITTLGIVCLLLSGCAGSEKKNMHEMHKKQMDSTMMTDAAQEDSMNEGMHKPMKNEMENSMDSTTKDTMEKAEDMMEKPAKDAMQKMQ